MTTEIDEGLVSIAEELNDFIKTSEFTNEDRKAFVDTLTGGICTSCGAVADNCHCENDE